MKKFNTLLFSAVLILFVTECSEQVVYGSPHYNDYPYPPNHIPPHPNDHGHQPNHADGHGQSNHVQPPNHGSNPPNHNNGNPGHPPNNSNNNHGNPSIQNPNNIPPKQTRGKEVTPKKVKR